MILRPWKYESPSLFVMCLLRPVFSPDLLKVKRAFHQKPAEAPEVVVVREATLNTLRAKTTLVQSSLIYRFS